MPIVTSIKPQKNKRRVNIYLDGKFGFGLDLENFIKIGLKVDQELSEKDIVEIVKKVEFQKVYDKILKFAALRPRSKKEFEGWLKKHKVHESLYKELFNRLKRLDLLDDEKFAFWWVEQRRQFRPKSKRILNNELKSKGIKREIIEHVFGEIKIDEVNAAKVLLSKKKRFWDKYEGYEKRIKISQYLARNGFSWDSIRAVVGEFDQEL